MYPGARDPGILSSLLLETLHDEDEQVILSRYEAEGVVGHDVDDPGLAECQRRRPHGIDGRRPCQHAMLDREGGTCGRAMIVGKVFQSC